MSSSINNRRIIGELNKKSQLRISKKLPLALTVATVVCASSMGFAPSALAESLDSNVTAHEPLTQDASLSGGKDLSVHEADAIDGSSESLNGDSKNTDQTLEAAKSVHEPIKEERISNETLKNNVEKLAVENPNNNEEAGNSVANGELEITDEKSGTSLRSQSAPAESSALRAVPESTDGEASTSAKEKQYIRYHANGGKFKGDKETLSEVIDESNWKTQYPDFVGKINELESRIIWNKESGKVENPQNRELYREGYIAMGWTTAPDSKEDVTEKLRAIKHESTTDYYVLWIPAYTYAFHSNGGEWEYKPSPAELGNTTGEYLANLNPSGFKIKPFETVMDNTNNANVNAGVFTLKPPANHMKFKGWYYDKDRDDRPYDFAPITSAVDIYAHWTTELRVDVLGDDDRNIIGYTVELINQKDTSKLTGDFTGSSSGKADDQWRTKSNEIDEGDSFEITLKDLPKGHTVEVFTNPILANIANVTPVEGKKNTFHIDILANPLKATSYAYYARFKLIKEEYKVQFESDEGGKITKPESLKVKYQDMLPYLPNTNPEDGYRFAGWKIKGDTTDTLYTPEKVIKEIKIEEDTTFVAQFKEYTLPLKLITNNTDGTRGAEVDYTVVDKDGNVVKGSVDEYNFWKSDNPLQPGEYTVTINNLADLQSVGIYQAGVAGTTVEQIGSNTFKVVIAPIPADYTQNSVHAGFALAASPDKPQPVQPTPPADEPAREIEAEYTGFYSQEKATPILSVPSTKDVDSTQVNVIESKDLPKTSDSASFMPVLLVSGVASLIFAGLASLFRRVRN